MTGTGIRSRRRYAGVSIAALAGAGLLTSSALIAVIDEDGSTIAFALSLITSAALIGVAGVTAVAAARWPKVPALSHRIFPDRSTRIGSLWASVAPATKTVVLAILAAVGTGAVIAIFTESWLLWIDEPIYFDWLDAAKDADRYGPNKLNWLGHPLPALGAGAIVGLSVRRCRVMAIAYPSILIFAWLLNIVLSWVSHRLRPVRGAHPGEFTSYPGGHSIQVALLLLMLPIALSAVTASKRARYLTTGAVVSLWAVTWADVIRTGGHWPTDQVAGFGIAVVILIIVYSVNADPRQHQNCRSCEQIKAQIATAEEPHDQTLPAGAAI